MEDDLKKMMQPKTIKSKNNGCGIVPGNLVLYFVQKAFLNFHVFQNNKQKIAQYENAFKLNFKVIIFI